MPNLTIKQFTHKKYYNKKASSQIIKTTNLMKMVCNKFENLDKIQYFEQKNLNCAVKNWKF